MTLKIAILGASQGTGALAAKEALARGHSVTAFARTPERLGLTHPNLTLRPGNFHDPASVRSAVEGHDAVIVSPGVTSMKVFKEKPDYFSLGTVHTIAAMKATGVRRLVVLSALGVGASRPLFPALIRMIAIDWLLKPAYADHEVQERLVRESGLDWVIAWPSRLTDGPAQNRYQKRTDLTKVPSSISRADLAHFLVDACDKPDWKGKSVALGG